MPEQDRPIKKTEKAFKKLEDRISKRLMKNIDKPVTDIVQEKLDKISWPCENTIEDINTIIASFVVLKNDFSKLRDILDHKIGSLTYLSSEYDDFMENFARISLDNQRFTKEVEQMKYKQLQSEKQ